MSFLILSALRAIWAFCSSYIFLVLKNRSALTRFFSSSKFLRFCYFGVRQYWSGYVNSTRRPFMVEFRGASANGWKWREGDAEFDSSVWVELLFSAVVVLESTSWFRNVFGQEYFFPRSVGRVGSIAAVEQGGGDIWSRVVRSCVSNDNCWSIARLLMKTHWVYPMRK